MAKAHVFQTRKFGASQDQQACCITKLVKTRAGAQSSCVPDQQLASAQSLSKQTTGAQRSCAPDQQTFCSTKLVKTQGWSIKKLCPRSGLPLAIKYQSATMLAPLFFYTNSTKRTTMAPAGLVEKRSASFC